MNRKDRAITSGGFNREWTTHDGRRPRLCAMCGEGPRKFGKKTYYRGILKKDENVICDECYPLVRNTYGNDWPEWLHYLISATRRQEYIDGVRKPLPKAERERLEYIKKEHLATWNENVYNYIDEVETPEELQPKDEVGTPEEQLLEKEHKSIREKQGTLAMKLVNELEDETEKTIAMKVWVEGCTQTEVAKSLGMKQYQVSRIISRLQTRLAKEIRSRF